MRGNLACSDPPLTAQPLFFGVTVRCGPGLSQVMGVKGSRASQERAHLGPGGNVAHLVTCHGRGSSRLSVRPPLAGTGVSLLGGREQGRVFVPSATSVGLKRPGFLSLCVPGVSSALNVPRPVPAHPAFRLIVRPEATPRFTKLPHDFLQTGGTRTGSRASLVTEPAPPQHLPRPYPWHLPSLSFLLAHGHLQNCLSAKQGAKKVEPGNRKEQEKLHIHAADAVGAFSPPRSRALATEELRSVTQLKAESQEDVFPSQIPAPGSKTNQKSMRD